MYGAASIGSGAASTGVAVGAVTTGSGVLAVIAGLMAASMTVTLIRNARRTAPDQRP